MKHPMKQINLVVGSKQKEVSLPCSSHQLKPVDSAYSIARSYGLGLPPEA